MLDGVGERTEVVEDVLRVGALQDRVEPPAVVDGVDLADLVVLGAGGLPSLRTFDGLITTPSSSPLRSARIACTASPWASSS